MYHIQKPPLIDWHKILVLGHALENISAAKILLQFIKAY